MTITIKDIVREELTKACLEATAKYRDKQDKEKKKKQFSEEKIAKVRELIKAQGWDDTMTNRQMEIYSILMDAPELKAKSLIPTESLVVVVAEKNLGLHSYATNTPYIATARDGNTGIACLHQDGRAGPSWIVIRDEPRYATDDEVSACMEKLTNAQFITIMSNAAFKTVVEAAMARAINVQEAEPEPARALEDGEEVSMPDGRRITV